MRACDRASASSSQPEQLITNNEQMAEFFLGTWPTVVSSFTTATAKGSAALYGSL